MRNYRFFYNQWSLHPRLDKDHWKTTDSSIWVMLQSHHLPHLRKRKMFFLTLSESFVPHTLVQSTLNNPKHMIFYVSQILRSHVPHIFCTVLTMFCVEGKKPANMIKRSLNIKTHNKRENQPYVFYFFCHSQALETLTLMTSEPISQGPTSFPKIKHPPPNFRHQKGDIKQVLYTHNSGVTCEPHHYLAVSDWCYEWYTFLHIKKKEIIMLKILGTNVQNLVT
jgi:hypothetical protein